MKRIVFALLALTLLISMASCQETAKETETVDEATVTEEVKTTDVGDPITEAYNNCLKMHWHLENMKYDDIAEGDAVINYKILERYKNCSKEELAELIAEQDCNFETLDSLGRNHCFDCLYDMMICLMRDGYIILVDGNIYEAN